MLPLRRQHRAAAVAAADGGVEKLAAKALLGVADDPPGLGVGHFHGLGGGAQGPVHLHLLHQLRHAGTEDPFSVLIKAGGQFHFHGLPPNLWMTVFYHI